MYTMDNIILVSNQDFSNYEKIKTVFHMLPTQKKGMEILKNVLIQQNFRKSIFFPLNRYMYYIFSNLELKSC